MSDAVAAGRGLRIPVAHRSPVKAVAGAGTARGRGLVVTAGGDGKIRSWVADSGEAAEFVASDDGNSVSFLAVADVAGARLIISGDDTAVRRFDMASGEEVGQPLRVPGTEWVRFGGLGPVAVHADSDEVLLVAGGINGRVHRWNLVTGELLGQSVGGHDGKVLSVDVMRLRSGRFVIVSGGVDGLVLRWDAATGEPIGEPMPGNRAPVTAFACVSGAAGRDVVIGQEYRGPIHLWDAVTGQPIVAPLPQAGHGVSSGGMAVTPDGRVLLSLDAGGTPWLWDLASAEPVAEPLSVPVSMVNAVAVVPSLEGPLFVTGGGSGQLRRWDVAGRAVGDDMPGHPAPVADVFGALASPQSAGRAVLVSVGRDGARCWDAATGRQVGTAPLDPLPVGDRSAAVWLADGRLILASGTEEGVLRCDVLAGSVENAELGSSDDEDEPNHPTIADVAAGMLPDGRHVFATAGSDGSVYLIDPATGRSVRGPLRGLESQALAVAFTTLPDRTGMVAAGGEDRRIVRWDAVTGEQIGKPLQVGRRWVMRLAFRVLRDGRLLLISADDAGQIRRWNAHTGESISEPLQAPGKPGDAPRFDATAFGEVLAVGCGGIVRRWNTLTGQHLGDTLDANCATSIALADGRIVVATGNTDGSITIAPASVKLPRTG